MTGWGLNRTGVLLLLALLSLGGCRTIAKVESLGQATWSGLGVSLTLPAGSWEIEEVIPGTAFQFRNARKSERFVLMRLPARKDEPPWLPLKRLFVHFKKKRRLARWPRTLPSGEVAECAEYLVKDEGKEVIIVACVLRRGRRTYEVASWSLRTGRAAAMRTADAIVASLQFADKRGGAAP